MAIFIEFKNPNTEESVVEVFRGDTALTVDTLPENPIATLTNGETSYRDDDLVIGNTYHYILRTTIGNVVYHSPNLVRRNVRNTGPGPQELAFGDEHHGYYGTCKLGEIAPMANINALLINSSLALAMNEDVHKFAYRGRTLFVPNISSITGLTISGFNTSLDVTTARAANYVAMLSTGDPEKDAIIQNAYNTTYNIPEEQRISKLVLDGGDTKYQVRLPRLYDEYPEIEVTGTAISSNAILDPVEGHSYGEAFKLFYCAQTSTIVTSRMSDYARARGAWRNASFTGLTLTNDIATVPNVVYNNIKHATANVTNRAFNSNYKATAHSALAMTYVRILPIFEVIED